MTKVAAIKNQMKGLSTKFALTWLTQKGAKSATFFWAGKLWTVEKALKELEEDLLEMSCGGLGVIRFFGGPPGAAKWHDGTILSMMCDVILFEESTAGASETARLSV
jgi:hypothetical protein